MMKLLRAFKTEIDPTPEQKAVITKTIGVCRYVYNLFIAHNQEVYKAGGPFINNNKFSKWLNNGYIRAHPDEKWIKDVSSKSVRQAINNACTAHKRFFKGESKFPCYKKKRNSNQGMYFVKNNPSDCLCERHRIKIPALGWVRLKEKGYIPATKDGYTIRSGTVSVKAGRYYVSVLINMPDKEPVRPENPGIGIDLGIKEFAVLSDGRVYKNINKTAKVKKIEKKLRREQRSLSRKQENQKKGEAAQFKNINKQRRKVQKLYHKLDCIRTDYINQVIAGIVKTKPSYVVLEDLNVSGMMANRHLRGAVASQKFYTFRVKLMAKNRQSGIETRIVDRWYPSSKLCHACGKRKAGLKLSDRKFVCECGYQADRDYNASLNLRDAKIYAVAE